MLRVLKRIVKAYVVVMVCYFAVFKIINLMFDKEKENTHRARNKTNKPARISTVDIKQFVIKNETAKPKSQTKALVVNKPLNNSLKTIKPIGKGKIDVNDKKTWKKKIAFRRKNFGRLEEWDSDPEMKKILLWTGYGPQQEGMLLWKRVFNSIGLQYKFFNKITVIVHSSFW